MSPVTIDFSQYEGASPPSAIDFSKYVQPAPVSQSSSMDLLLPGGKEERETLLREVSSAWDTIKNAPKAVIQAITTPPTPEEAQRYGGPEQVAGSKRVGLALERLTTQPVGIAADWYKDAAKGKVSDPVGQALSVAPEAMGSAAGNVVASKALSMAPEAARAIPGAVSKVATATGDVLKSPTTASVIHKGAHYAGAGIGYEAGEAVGHPILGAGAGAAAAKAISPWLAEQVARLGLKLSPEDLAGLGERYFPSGKSDAMSGEVPPELDALSEAASRSVRPAALPANMPPQATASAVQGVQPPASATLPSGPTQANYPEGVNPRPTNRAEIVDDRAVQDAMRHDLDKHGWNALSEERQKYYADNAPQMTKSQIIAHFQAQQIMEEATVKVQQVLEQARVKAETPARFTKTTIPKAPKAPKPASTVGLDVNQDLTDILQRSLDAINAKKGQ